MNRAKIISLVAILVFATSFFSGCSTSDDSAIQPVMGNSSGNIDNEGIAARQGDWVYFASGESIYKEKPDGSERELVIDAHAYHINVADDWIYYSWFTEDEAKIWKVRTDGTGHTVLYEDMSGDRYVGSLLVVGDWIYFSTGSPEGESLSKLHKMKTDGTGLAVIGTDKVSSLNVAGDWIYYANGSDGWKIYKMKADGTEKMLLSEEPARSMTVHEDGMYYISETDLNIYRLNMDGTGKVKLGDDRAFTMNVSDGWIFYSKESDDYKIYKMKLDGTEEIKISDDETTSINVVDDWIYYMHYEKDTNYYELGSDDGNVFKIRTDGTGRRVTVSARGNVDDQEVTLSTFVEKASALAGEFGKTYDCLRYQAERYQMKVVSIETMKELDGETYEIVIGFEGSSASILDSLSFFDEDGRVIPLTRRKVIRYGNVAFSGYELNLAESGKFIVFNELDPFKYSGKNAMVFEVPNRDASSPPSFKAIDKTNIIAISAGPHHVVGLKKDGTVIAAFREKLNLNLGEFDVSSWKDIVAVSAGGDGWGNLLTVGLKKDGTMVDTQAIGRDESDPTASWTDLKAVDAGGYHIVGLKKDGTVVAAGEYPGRDVSGWTDIVAISAGESYTVGLKSDGTVVATGVNDQHQCDVSEWKSIVAVTTGRRHTVGLRNDGTVIAVGDDYFRQCAVSSWTDIVAISAGNDQTVGLKRDGTIVSTRYDNLSEWANIVEIASGAEIIIGLRKDGTVQQHNFGSSVLSDWKGVEVP